MAAAAPSLDHIGYVVRSLDALREDFARLGFTTTEPRELMRVDAATGAAVSLRQRSCHAVLQRGYIELSAVETDDPRHHLAAYRRRGDGLHIVALGSDSIGAEYRRCLASGVRATAPAHAARRIEYGERHGEAHFGWFMVAPEESPEALLCYTANLTPELVYQPAVMNHANGALALVEACLLADDAAATAARYGRFLGSAVRERSGDFVFELEGGRLSIVDAQGYERRFAVAPRDEDARFVAAVIRVRDLGRCAELMRERGVVAWRSAGWLVTRLGAGGDTLVAFCD